MANIYRVKFSATPFEMSLIVKIVDRAEAIYSRIPRVGGIKPLDKKALMMDLDACISNGCPLRLDELLAADDGSFGHDVFGIQRFMDRKTGKLGGCFRPRFALTKETR